MPNWFKSNIEEYFSYSGPIFYTANSHEINTHCKDIIEHFSGKAAYD